MVFRDTVSKLSQRASNRSNEESRFEQSNRLCFKGPRVCLARVTVSLQTFRMTPRSPAFQRLSRELFLANVDAHVIARALHGTINCQLSAMRCHAHPGDVQLLEGRRAISEIPDLLLRQTIWGSRASRCPLIPN